MGLNRYVLTLFFKCCVFLCSTQTRQWVSFSRAEKTKALAEEKNEVWVGSSAGLARIDKRTGNHIFYDKANSGLPVNSILAVAVDQNGIKWIGTEGGGLVMYDGSNWTVFNTVNSGVPSDIVTTIFPDAEGNKWIGTSAGLAKLDNRQQWTVYTVSNSGLPANHINQVITENKDLWIATAKGIARFNENRFITYNKTNSQLSSDNVKCITIGRNGEKWIGLGNEYTYNNGGLLHIEGENWTIYNTSNSALPSNDVNALYANQNGTVFIGTGNNEFATLLKLESGKWSYSEFAEDAITSIMIDREGNEWFATEESGIKQISGTSIRSFNVSNSNLSSNAVAEIVFDERNNKWIVTSEGFISSFDGETWTNYQNKNATNAAYNTVEIDNDGVKWIAGENLFAFNGNSWQDFTPPSHVVPFFYATCMETDADGIKWIGTDAGLLKFDGVSWTVFNMPGDNMVRSIAIDKQGNKWIGTDDAGLLRFSEEIAIIYNTSNSGIAGNRITSIAIDDEGNKWVAAYMGGLCVFDDYSWTVYDTVNSGLPDDRIRDIAIDHNGTKWIATHSGLSKFDGSTWKVFNSTNSLLADNYILSLSIDAYNNKWLCLPVAGINIFNEEGVRLENKKLKPVQQPEPVTIFPNPSAGKFQVVLSEEKAARSAKVNVYDILGNRVFSNGNHSKTVFNVDISSLPRGIYFVEVDTGREKINRKIVVN